MTTNVNLTAANGQIRVVSSFEQLISAPFRGRVNAICWERNLPGDFSEIVERTEVTGSMVEIGPRELNRLRLSEQGELARGILLRDFELLRAQGFAPVLNVIRNYERDNDNAALATDVYSFHADRSPVPADTYLCTYFGRASEILPNPLAKKKVLIPEIRDELRKQFRGPEEGFESYLKDHFFDLHYRAMPGARPIDLGVGNLWKLAVDHPGSKVPPCIHRAPAEKTGEKRLLMIC